MGRQWQTQHNCANIAVSPRGLPRHQGHPPGGQRRPRGEGRQSHNLSRPHGGLGNGYPEAALLIGHLSGRDELIVSKIEDRDKRATVRIHQVADIENVPSGETVLSSAVRSSHPI